MPNSSIAAPSNRPGVASAFIVAPSPAIERAVPVQAESSPIAERAREQFAVFEVRLRAAGRAPVVVDMPSAPLDSCVGDLAVMLPAGAVLMRPSDLARRGEVAAIDVALRKAGVPIVGRIEAPGLLDGGDVIAASGALYIGVPQERGALVGITQTVRGNEHGRAQMAALAKAAGMAAIEVPVAADVKRLRAVASLVDDRTLLVAAGVVDTRPFDGLRIISVARGDDYGAGVLQLRAGRVIANTRFVSVIPALRKAGIRVDAIDLWEFGKAGITPSLMAILPMSR